MGARLEEQWGLVMQEVVGAWSAVRELGQEEEGEYVRRARQHEDLQHLYEAIACCAEKRDDGWGADRGDMHEVILKRRGRAVGTWSRSGDSFLFSYADTARSPVRAKSFQDLSQRTAEIIATYLPRRAGPLARLMGLATRVREDA